ncbi:hypothetical protein GBAR_LOCUS29540 [Geodia barretti]|uniref:Uncharacterized protein n=1 Tax=Geodia barretti TaxID=519541 RepID=A0AA35TTA8_GEOBA|nr:hypothetical protein GBAR_LOCUS29540 [Geodia barretti]
MTTLHLPSLHPHKTTHLTPSSHYQEGPSQNQGMEPLM